MSIYPDKVGRRMPWDFQPATPGDLVIVGTYPTPGEPLTRTPGRVTAVDDARRVTVWQPSGRAVPAQTITGWAEVLVGPAAEVDVDAALAELFETGVQRWDKIAAVIQKHQSTPS